MAAGVTVAAVVGAFVFFGPNGKIEISIAQQSFIEFLFKDLHDCEKGEDKSVDYIILAERVF